MAYRARREFAGIVAGLANQIEKMAPIPPSVGQVHDKLFHGAQSLRSGVQQVTTGLDNGDVDTFKAGLAQVVAGRELMREGVALQPGSLSWNN